MASSKHNAVTCTAWVPQGIAQENPHKIEITKEELEEFIKKTSKRFKNQKGVKADIDYAAIGERASKDKKKVLSNVNEKKQKDIQTKGGGAIENERNDFEERYKFEEYDNEEGNDDELRSTAPATIGADPYITNKESDDESEEADTKIKPTDNLIAVGHMDEDASSLDIYVYNSEEESLYIHHDILLSSIPLCLEWLNYNPGEENLKPGNMIAVGSISSSIEVWDLDVVDVLEPAYILSGQTKKKMGKKPKPRSGHQDAVLCLAWNKHFEHILASGSADKSVILWDLEKMQEAQRIDKFQGRVQDIKWHPDNNDQLLTGCANKELKLFECSSNSQCMSWELDGEVECLCWNTGPGLSYNIFASTEFGTVYSIDVRQSKPLNKFQAHDKACTGMVFNHLCPGCFVSVSEDETVKIWDLQKEGASLVEEIDPNLGVIHNVSCSPDSPFVLSLGGNNNQNNFKVWDIRNSIKVREAFRDRLGLPIEDEQEMNTSSSKNIPPNSEKVDSSVASRGTHARSLPKKAKRRKRFPKGKIE